jgi:hypothetical protein
MLGGRSQRHACAMHGQELMGAAWAIWLCCHGVEPPLTPPPSGLLALVGAMAVEPTCLVVEVSDTPMLCMGRS